MHEIFDGPVSKTSCMKIAPSHESQSSNDENEFIHVTPEERKKPFIRYLPFSFEALARFKFLILIFDQTVHP